MYIQIKPAKRKRKQKENKNIKNNFTKKQYKEFPMIYITGEELVCFVISVEERTAVQWFKSLGKTVRS